MGVSGREREGEREKEKRENPLRSDGSLGFLWFLQHFIVVFVCLLICFHYLNKYLLH